jgi:hypothetical protein
MRTRTSILLASTMTVAGLATGVTPAYAATRSASVEVGEAYYRFNLEGTPFRLQSNADCLPIPDAVVFPAFSARNTSESSTITFYSYAAPFIFCRDQDQLAQLGPGEIDTGYISRNRFSLLGRYGATYYSST